MSRTPFVQRKIEACSNRKRHTEGPEGYLAWHEWAEERAKTHYQERCPGCGFWLIERQRSTR